VLEGHRGTRGCIIYISRSIYSVVSERISSRLGGLSYALKAVGGSADDRAVIEVVKRSANADPRIVLALARLTPYRNLIELIMFQHIFSTATSLSILALIFAIRNSAAPAAELPIYNLVPLISPMCMYLQLVFDHACWNRSAHIKMSGQHPAVSMEFLPQMDLISQAFTASMY
jgi:hypothetical protein